MSLLELNLYSVLSLSVACPPRKNSLDTTASMERTAQGVCGMRSLVHFVYNNLKKEEHIGCGAQGPHCEFHNLPRVRMLV